MLPLIAAGLVFLAVVLLLAGLGWVLQTDRSLRARLARASGPPSPLELIKPEPPRAPGRFGALLAGAGFVDRLAVLSVQAGYGGAPGDVLLGMVALAGVGGAAAWLRTGGLVWGLLGAVMAGSLPVVYLLHRRRRRLNRIETQLPDGLDMITRALRAGNALTGAIKLVGEEMPDPIGAEFRRVEEEIRLGVDPGDALAGLQQRVPTEDVRFFCTAIRIQRGTGGNLAEVLERLAEVIRERFKVLSYARVLSSQHRWTAVLVGLSPIVFGILFQMLNPGFFDAMFGDPLGPTLILSGLVLEALGFYMVWRIARIKV